MSTFVRGIAPRLLIVAVGATTFLSGSVPAAAQRRTTPPPARARPATAAGGGAGAPALGALGAADRALVLRMLAAEDRRARDSASEALILGALRQRSPLVRRVAVRAVGRLQRGALTDSIVPLMRDADLSVRAEAVNAYGQAMQGIRSAVLNAADRRAALDGAIEDLIRAAEATRDPNVLGVVARTLGRLPYADSSLSVDVARVMLEMAQRPVAVGGGATRPVASVNVQAAEGVAHGLYALARTRRTTGALPPEVIGWLREATRFAAAASGEGGARVRRLAMLALVAAGDGDAEVQQRAARDPDEQVRRLAVVYQQGWRDQAARRAAVMTALADSSWLVRFEAVRAYRGLGSGEGCGPLIAAVGDRSPHVSIGAIDVLGGGCADTTRAADTLLGITDSRNPQHITRTKGNAGWQPYAHALLALARIAPTRAAPLVRRDAAHPLAQVRTYVARAATLVRDTTTLSVLAADGNGNVREAALDGLRTTVGHAADGLFVRALGSGDYHVILAAAHGLEGSPLGDSVTTLALSVLDRLTAERRENSRDPRVALLARIGELGAARHAQRLLPYTADFDTAVAQAATKILERWTLRRIVATPKPLAPPADPVGSVVGGDYRMVFRMAASSGGGLFSVRLATDDAPATVARLVRLAREGWYDGRTFHRVEPAFVIQGGSPKATEYVGDGPFMRDEVGLPSHVRGTLGISTRGRDTGDAQVFVNLTDNYRLDHDYTVLGEIVQGRDVAEGVLEGDVIERVEIVRVR